MDNRSDGPFQRTIEAAIGGAPIRLTIEGRNWFSINLRDPQDLRGDIDALKQLLVPAGEHRGHGRRRRHALRNHGSG